MVGARPMGEYNPLCGEGKCGNRQTHPRRVLKTQTADLSRSGLSPPEQMKDDAREMP